MSAAREALSALLEGTPYEAVRSLGQGGMGEVVLARHRGLGTQVVVKLLRRELADEPRLVDRLRLEAQALAHLRHENLVPVHDLGATPAGRPYFVMPYYPGRTLRELVRERGALPARRAIELTLGLLAGLSVVHDAGLVHRDLKLDNLYLAELGGREVVKILDFGVIKVVSAAAPVAAPYAPTAEGVVVGTPRYAAPEQVLGREIDARADLYAVGAILYVLLTGHLVFEDADVVELLRAHVGRAPVPPSVHVPSLPPELDALVLACLAKRPAERPSSARELAARLRAVRARLERSEAEAPSPALAPAAPAPPAPVTPAPPLRMGPALDATATMDHAPLARAGGHADPAARSPRSAPHPPPALPPPGLAPPPRLSWPQLAALALAGAGLAALARILLRLVGWPS
jgi:serine/threonine protein kinase